jgi:hypothetical protein
MVWIFLPNDRRNPEDARPYQLVYLKEIQVL